jgi:hypothetical protein
MEFFIFKIWKLKLKRIFQVYIPRLSCKHFLLILTFDSMKESRDNKEVRKRASWTFFFCLFPHSTLNVHPTLAFRRIINYPSHILSVIIEETHNKMLARANHNHHHFRFVFWRLQINGEN